MIKWLILFMLFSAPVFAGVNVCHTGKIVTHTSLRGSIPGCESINAIGSDTTIYDVVKNLIQTVPRKYLKWDANIITGSKLVEMSQFEKDVVDQAEADTQHQVLLNRIDKYNVDNIHLLTALVKVINVRIPNNPITKAEMITQIKEELGI